MLYLNKFILCCVSLVILTTSNALAEQFNSALKLTYHQKVINNFTKFAIPGGAYVVVKGERILALETIGYTDLSEARTVNAETAFRLASVSKTFAATVTTMLAREKRLNLDDPVTRFAPNFKLADKNAADRITLKHLLSHSSGLIPNAYDNLLHEGWSMDKILSRFRKIKPLCQPAQCYGYQNIAYSLLQPAVEASQPKSYAQLLQHRVFTPLAMNNASVGYQAFIRNSNIAKPHILRKRINTGQFDRSGKAIRQYIWRTVAVAPDYYQVSPAAGVNASIVDMAKWLIANLGFKPEVLSKALLAEMTEPRIQTKRDLRKRYWRRLLKDAHYGYGWRIYQMQDFKLIYHSGWVEGYRADIGYAPELGIGFAMLMNAESNVIGKLSAEFWSNAKLYTSGLDH
ncbi:serine hydrolase domain-containing protein [Catenovulum agarivorans]|uniref:serine hydrolase domain-containing protein n=1 Tax=Catenovulum agarivorans TaxID=1172192 RepID=UPI0006849D4C|nr:serine hydrolase domain-containing protein [Catenovulum agarivorans]